MYLSEITPFPKEDRLIKWYQRYRIAKAVLALAILIAAIVFIFQPLARPPIFAFFWSETWLLFTVIGLVIATTDYGVRQPVPFVTMLVDGAMFAFSLGTLCRLISILLS